ncbi:MAG: ACT domain-containing protein [Microthrixaceae bacterium]
MATFVLRVWLPDRPGALGAVATRVGAVRGDVIGIDIIERGAGSAVDELVVDIPEPELLELLLDEIGQVEGVAVEDVRPLDGPPEDPAVAALEVAVALDAADPLEALVSGTVRLLRADWSAVVEPAAGAVLASTGQDLPSDAWLSAFVGGALASGGASELPELAVAALASGRGVLVASRSHLPLRGRERDVLAGLARLV